MRGIYVPIAWLPLKKIATENVFSKGNKLISGCLGGIKMWKYYPYGCLISVALY
jgi:hypothetical protein